MGGQSSKEGEFKRGRRDDDEEIVYDEYGEAFGRDKPAYDEPTTIMAKAEARKKKPSFLSRAWRSLRGIKEQGPVEPPQEMLVTLPAGTEKGQVCHDVAPKASPMKGKMFRYKFPRKGKEGMEMTVKVIWEGETRPIDAIESESSDEEDKGPLSKFGFGKVDQEGIAEELLGIGGKDEKKKAKKEDDEIQFIDEGSQVKQKAKNHEKKASRSQDNSPLPGSPMNLEGEAGEWKAGFTRVEAKKPVKLNMTSKVISQEVLEYVEHRRSNLSGAAMDRDAVKAKTKRLGPKRERTVGSNGFFRDELPTQILKREHVDTKNKVCTKCRRRSKDCKCADKFLEFEYHSEDEKKHEMERMLADSDDEAPAPPPPPAAAAALELAAKETRIRLEREKREKAQKEMEEYKKKRYADSMKPDSGAKFSRSHAIAAIKAFESSEEKKNYTSTSTGKAAGAAASRSRFKTLALAAIVKVQGK